MLTYIARRILYSIPVLLATSFLSFTFITKSSDPLANLRANPRDNNPVLLHHLAHVYHLDQSLPVRYWYWLQDVFIHKLGISLLTSQPIWPDISVAIEHTLQIILLAQVIALVLGVAVGIYSAIRQYSPFDYTMTSLSFLGYAMPTFWLALILQIVFVDIYLKWHVRIFYTSGLNSGVTSNTWSIDRLQHIALPVVTLTVVSFALYSRYMRATMLDVINSDYVRTARAKGLPERLVIFRHVVRNALIPIVTVSALQFGALLGGAIVTESIFQLNGMGYFFISRLQTNDVYSVMAYVMIVAITVIIFNLLADILYGYLDPRIRYD
jgi:ABC-type dipeptide/oligopeptide/nickel transport system permease component